MIEQVLASGEDRLVVRGPDRRVIGTTNEGSGNGPGALVDGEETASGS
jgi:hypothetical protein